MIPYQREDGLRDYRTERVYLIKRSWLERLIDWWHSWEG